MLRTVYEGRAGGKDEDCTPSKLASPCLHGGTEASKQAQGVGERQAAGGMYDLPEAKTKTPWFVPSTMFVLKIQKSYRS